MINGVTRSELAEIAEVSEQTIRGIEDGKQFRTNDSIAENIANAFGISALEIFDPCELSHLGRPAGTGRPISTILQLVRDFETVCETHHLVVPRQAGCHECVAA